VIGWVLRSLAGFVHKVRGSGPWRHEPRVWNPQAPPEDTGHDRSGAAWLRIHSDSPSAIQAGARLCATLHRAHTDATGYTWSQLDVPTGVGGADMVDAVVGQLRFAIEAIVTEPEASEN
jgi:hypothetical protein